MAVATVAQVAGIAAAVPSRDRALVMVAAYGRLRWGELAGLTVKRVDVPRARIHVVEQVTEVNGRFLVGPPKTDAGRRVVALPAVAAMALREHLDRFADGDPNALVFPSPEASSCAGATSAAACGCPRRGRSVSRGSGSTIFVTRRPPSP